MTIESLIINGPYEKPTSYWQYDREITDFVLKQGRRPAGYLVALNQSHDDPGEFHELPLVNRIRTRVDEWREKNYPGVTGITKRLLKLWRIILNKCLNENWYYAQAGVLACV